MKNCILKRYSKYFQGTLIIESIIEECLFNDKLYELEILKQKFDPNFNQNSKGSPTIILKCDDCVLKSNTVEYKQFTQWYFKVRHTL